MKIISVANQKGGVGKTTTAINLATSLVSIGKKVLILDFDPQGNAATGLGVKDLNNNSYNFITGDSSLEDCIKETNIENLKIIPSTVDLAAAEFEIFQSENSNFILKERMKNIENHNYDFILIDCPPALGMLTINAMCFSDTVLIPLQCEFFALDGLTKLFQTFQRVKNNFNKKLEIEGILLTMYDTRNKLTKQVEQDVRNSYFKNKVYDTVIPRNVRVSEATSYGEPLLIYDLECAASKAYIGLAEEFIQNNNL